MGGTDCSLSQWSDWTLCASCLDQRHRSRRIAVNATRGGWPCSGPLEEEAACPGDCEPEPRPFCEWQPWTQWSACSATCETGVQHRSRHLAKHDGLGKSGNESLLQQYQQLQDEYREKRPLAVRLTMAFSCGLIVAVFLLTARRLFSASADTGWF